MKRIFVVILFLTFSFLINISIAEAKSVSEVCYYKTSDSNFTFAVKAYDDGTSDAILMNPYTEADFGNHQGHKESQDYMATWTDVGEVLNGSTCKQYMKYTVNSGPNSIEFHDSTPSLGNNDLLLTNYDFEGQASKCVYKDLTESKYNMTFTVFADQNSIFTYYNDDLNLAMVDELSMGNIIDKNKTDHVIHNDFYDSFMQYFYDETQGCPVIDSVQSHVDNVGTTTVWFRAVADSVTSPMFGLISSEYPDDVKPTQELKSYPIYFSDGNAEFVFYIKSYDDKSERICVNINNAEACVQMNDSEDRIFIYQGTINDKFYQFSIKKEDIDDVFQYEDPNDYSTLINPNPIYYTEDFYGYYISKTGGDSSLYNVVSSTDSKRNMGFDYKDKMCALKPYILELTDTNLNYNLEVYHLYNDNKEIYTIQSLPCDTWGYNYTYSCTGDQCKDNLPYEVRQKLFDVAEYCQGIYQSYGESNTISTKRLDECISFVNFYNELVSNNVIEDYSGDCGILSKDIRDKLTWILDIIKIAGPILAVGLGTLDFVKVVASGDADKEMKSAFKRFGTRIVAAVLLFLVPVILAFLMDTFLGNQAGYDSDNPFCDIVEFNE